MEGDIIVMSAKEIRRLGVIHKILERRLTQVEASEILDLTARQVKRIVKRIRREGDKGLMHKSRGRPSNRRYPVDLKEQVLEYYKKGHHDFGPTLANEKFKEISDIEISAQTFRNWLIEAGLWQKSRKARTHRQWRERKGHFGEMLQMDGSHHDWLEGRGPELVLMACIDDAASNTFFRFYDYEGTIPAMDCFKRYVRRCGFPQSVYLDRHTTYKSPRRLTAEEELEGVTEPLSEFERALKELGVKLIHANSPQAKGRVERLFKTLQDRLVKEMRLKGIKTKDEANRFLEKGYIEGHNRRFSVLPVKEGDLHRSLLEGFDLDGVLCIKTKRTLRNDWTVAHNKKLYQVIAPVNTKKVVVEERLNGKLFLTYNGQALGYKEITTRPMKEKPSKPFKIRKKYIPPKDHPWRRYPLQLDKGTFLNNLKGDISNCG